MFDRCILAQVMWSTRNKGSTRDGWDPKLWNCSPRTWFRAANQPQCIRSCHVSSLNPPFPIPTHLSTIYSYCNRNQCFKTRPSLYLHSVMKLSCHIYLVWSEWEWFVCNVLCTVYINQSSEIPYFATSYAVEDNKYYWKPLSNFFLVTTKIFFEKNIIRSGTRYGYQVWAKSTDCPFGSSKNKLQFHDLELIN